ncbi:TPA: multidrug ABC transporter permease [Candidatus Delongbacteria bacterium]|nr:multidrug ABC transporter permease [Candidatus Delongbacteria bacterium]
MKKFTGFFIKECLHLIRDYRTMMILIGMPVIQIILFGFAIRNELNSVNIGILDKSKDEITTELTSKILSSEYFILKEYFTDERQIDTSFKKGHIKEVIIFESGFAEKLKKEGRAEVQIITDASEPNMANLALSYTTSIIQNYSMTLSKGKDQPLIISPEIKMLYNEELKSVFMFVPGIMATLLMLISAMMTSITITKEKEFGTMEVLLASPLKPYQIIFGKVAPYLLLSLVNLALILWISTSVFGMPVRGSYLLLIAECSLFITTALSLGILISTVTSSMQVAMMISLVGLMMPTVLLSGFIFPIENMPWPLQWISHILPAKWFVIIIKNIMLKGTGFSYVYKETAVLVLMTVFLLGLSIKKFKTRL